MDNTQDGGTANRPPVLEDPNYNYWKVVVKGSKNPVITSKDGSTILNPEDDWSKDEDDEALGHDKALNVIFNGVDKNMF